MAAPINLPLFVQVLPSGGRVPTIARPLGRDIATPGELLGPALPPRYGMITRGAFNEDSLTRRGWTPDAAAAAVGVSAWGVNWWGKV
ncbi:hypothetical protein [Usitatibacter rugosus]|uniref:hypothetical protein n=1 Tax=Usitatibacter rugosus TaxID=2732067 RepID=UPI00148867E7|nr:hypothetical protein [Usitatibacter rugosus]